MSAAGGTTTPLLPTPGRERRARPGARLWADRWPYLFLLPTVVLYGGWQLWPTVSSIFYSMLDWRGLGQDRSFVGLANFQRALHDDLFWKSLGVTLAIIVVTVPIRVLVALVLALVLNNPKLPFVGLFRTMFFVPVVATTAILGIVMNFVLDPSGGPVNSFLLETGLRDTPIDFLGSSGPALWSVMAVHVWKWMGITLVYWLAALQTVPRDVYEAAQIDGSGWFSTLRHIVIPLMRPFLAIITLLTAVETMQIFDLVQTMTGGGPFFATLVTEVYIYQQAFGTANPSLGYASALGVLFGIVTSVVAALMLLGTQLGRGRAHT